jgi:flagellar motility protein MotE (MotC chaperone)
MNPTIRVAMMAIFTTMGTSYFLAGGIFHLVQVARTPRSFPLFTPDIVPPFTPAPGIPLALEVSVKEDHSVPLRSEPDPNEAKWRYAELERESLKTQLEVQVKTLVRMEESAKASAERADGFEKKMAEAQALMQETTNALEAAQIRIGKMESAVKKAEEAERQATLSAKRMVKMFVTMPPDNAAKILAELPNKETADLLARMKEAEAAAILVLFPPKRAAALSARLAGKRGGPP